MYRPPSWGGDKIIGYYAPDIVLFDDHFDKEPNDLPAWSMHRLIEMTASKWQEYMVFLPNAYDEIISDIEIMIGRGDFPKEYLV